MYPIAKRFLHDVLVTAFWQNDNISAVSLLPLTDLKELLGKRILDKILRYKFSKVPSNDTFFYSNMVIFDSSM